MSKSKISTKSTAARAWLMLVADGTSNASSSDAPDDVLADDVLDGRIERALDTLTNADEAALLAHLDSTSAAQKDADHASSELAHEDARWWLVRALAQIGTARSLPLLRQIAAAESTERDELRAIAARALGEIIARNDAANNSDANGSRTSRSNRNDKDTKAAESSDTLYALAALLTDASSLVRQSASDALAQIGEPAINVLAEVMNQPHDGGRARAAYALRRIGTIATAPVLYHYLDDRNPLVRLHAYEALDKLGLLENNLYMP